MASGGWTRSGSRERGLRFDEEMSASTEASTDMRGRNSRGAGAHLDMNLVAGDSCAPPPGSLCTTPSGPEEDGTAPWAEFVQAGGSKEKMFVQGEEDSCTGVGHAGFCTGSHRGAEPYIAPLVVQECARPGPRDAHDLHRCGDMGLPSVTGHRLSRRTS